MNDIILTIFDGNSAPRTVNLNFFNKVSIEFGRSEGNDIVLASSLVSRNHGRFVLRDKQWFIEDKAVYTDGVSGNGLIYNNASILQKPLFEGDFIRIDDGVEAIVQGVLFVVASADSQNRWEQKNLNQKSEYKIGRDSSCDIVLPHSSVSKLHAVIKNENGSYYIRDNGSTNGIIINNVRVNGKTLLHEKDVIVITNTKLIFTAGTLFYCYYRSGISLDTANVVIKRKRGLKSFVTGNNVSVSIKPGELVAIVGGSGAGKSTILNAMCGYLPPADGQVYINGINLYENFGILKELIGYVPQSDIVYDNLTLSDMLKYTAKLRLPKDTAKSEIDEAVEKAVKIVELSDKMKSRISQLSGGQKKRASIAVELLSDPNILFLDEPASGLDPGTERNLMLSLRKMADSGKTVILVTHSTLQLSLCDKVLFMGRGGNLCFCGSLSESLQFFGVSDVVDVYNMITDNPMDWRKKYEDSLTKSDNKRSSARRVSSGNSKKKVQLPVLCTRYSKLVLNDLQRLLLLIAQAPVLALLISLVATGEQFDQYEITKSLLFALSCSAFWVGMLNSIQEVCKERSILRREYMVGLSLDSYIFSKIIVLGIMCFIQSLLIIFVFAAKVGLPDDGLFLSSYTELFITTFLTALASTAMGLFVSSLFTNADRAMTVAPILLMPQILFSGLIFKLEGLTSAISWFAVCRWSMEGYGTTADLNNLDLKLQQEGVPIPHEAEAFYDHNLLHLLQSWGMLILFIIVFLVLARLVLRSIKNEKG